MISRYNPSQQPFLRAVMCMIIMVIIMFSYYSRHDDGYL